MLTIATPDAPKAIGPYSQGIEVNGFLFTAGQIALDPATMEVVAGGITEQTDRVMKNLQNVLAASGMDLSHV
ncbi:MAG: Rid family hydrolase, partial [Gemmatimonadales bacterium]